MKKNIFKLQQVFFVVLVAGAMVSCEKDNVPAQEPEFTQEELAEMAAADKFAAANSVYRALGLLNELPDNWESAIYTPEVGVPVDEAHSDIRNVVSTGADHAKSYFLSIVPTEGLEGDTWSHEGVGTLTYRAVNEDNCYVVGRILNCAVEESALTDGTPDAEKMKPICFDPCAHVYRLMGEVTAKAFLCGKEV